MTTTDAGAELNTLREAFEVEQNDRCEVWLAEQEAEFAAQCDGRYHTFIESVGEQWSEEEAEAWKKWLLEAEPEWAEAEDEPWKETLAACEEAAA